MQLSTKEVEALKKVKKLLETLQFEVKNSSYPNYKSVADLVRNVLVLDNRKGWVQPEIDVIEKVLKINEEENITIVTEVLEEDNNIKRENKQSATVPCNQTNNENKNFEEYFQNLIIKSEADKKKLREKLVHIDENGQETSNVLQQFFREFREFREDCQHRHNINSQENSKVLTASLKVKAETNQNNEKKEQMDVAENTSQPKEEDKVTLNENMKNIVAEYNRAAQYRKGTKLGLNMEDEEERANHKPNLDEEPKVSPVLEKKGGNPSFYATKDNNNEYLIVPVKANDRGFTKEQIWIRAFFDFFDIEDKENLQERGNQFLLIKPAVVKQEQDEKYYLLQRGRLKLKLMS